MKKLELKNDDYLGYVKTIRHACRGIVVKDGKVLLGYEEKFNKCSKKIKNYISSDHQAHQYDPGY